MRSLGVKAIEAVRASVESLPFRNGVFDFALSLDVLEHVGKPRSATAEIYRVVEDGGALGVSLPLENWFQKLSRLGFMFMKILGDPILKRAKTIPIHRTPEYHYVGDISSYDNMLGMLEWFFKPLVTRYTSIGFHRTISINAVHILRKKWQNMKTPIIKRSIETFVTLRFIILKNAS